MKYIKVILLFQPILFVVHGSYHSQNTTVVDTHWTNFKLKFNKSYPTPQDEQLRFNYFVENLKLADTRNEMEIKLGGSAVHGITKFSDLAQTEYESLYTMRHLKSFEDIFGETNILNHAHPAKLELPKDSVGMVDWTDQYTTPVKDQGQCGSCWAFSAIEQIESDTMRMFALKYSLSVGEVVECIKQFSDDDVFGKAPSTCDEGGWPDAVYYYVPGAGLWTDSDYPYTSGNTGTIESCNNEIISWSGNWVIDLNDWFTFYDKRGHHAQESNLAAYVQSTGPLSVCVNADTWNTYTGEGVLNVCGTTVNHCVQAVGVDVDMEEGYWKIRNSWGTNWGEDGFIRISYGKNTCAVDSHASYTTPYAREFVTNDES